MLVLWYQLALPSKTREVLYFSYGAAISMPRFFPGHFVNVFILPLVTNGVPKPVVAPSVPTHIYVSWGTTTLQYYVLELQDQNVEPLFCFASLVYWD